MNGSKAPLLVGLLAVLAAAGGATAYFGLHRDAPAPPSEENAPLPTPAEPTQHALAPGAYQEDDWAWRNPRPRAMPTWFAVDVDASGQLVMVGQGGFAAHDEGGLFLGWSSGAHVDLHAVRITGPGEALAAGESGTLVRMTASGPRTLDAGTTSTLRGLAIVDPTTTLVVGDAGTVIRISGETASRLDVGVSGALLAAHARQHEAWIAGEDGVILHVTDPAIGRFVREHGPTDATLRAIGGCERGSLYAAGDDGTIARRHPESGEWHGLRLDFDTHETFTSIACDRGRAVVVGASGLVVLASGDQTVHLASGFDGTWHGAAGAGSGESARTWLVGGGGQMASVEVDHVQTRVGGPTVPLRDLATLAGAVVAVGEWGHVVRETADGFVLGASSTDAGLGAIATLDESTLVAVGDVGTIVRIDYDGVTTIDSHTHQSLHDVLASDGHLLIVGNEGAVLRGTVDAISPTRIPDVGDLWALAGTATDAIVVGDGGFVAHLDASGHRPIACALSASLRDVMAFSGAHYAVGEHGTIVRVDEAGCTPERAEPPLDASITLNAIGVGPRGRPLAVGDQGVAIERQDDGRWTPSDLDVARTSLRGIERIDGYVYVVGTGGAVLRHVVVDGS
jgi:photosystem II stability/assembly factor-like uncharacterized protein